MSLKKWMIAFLTAFAAVCLVVMGFNAAVDPFGIFGDVIFDDYAYDMTMNPRISKIEYLKKHHDKYNSYIIGCSKTSCYSVERLNKYYGNGTSFYNMLMYGGDMYDIEKTAEYIINTYEPKNIIINIGLEETTEYNTETDKIKQNLHPLADNKPLLPFYFRYASLNPQYSIDKLKNIKSRDYLMTGENIFVPETGAYNKQLRDISYIGTVEEYSAENAAEFENGEFTEQMQSLDKCVESVKNIVDLCKEKGINFKLIVSPIYEGELKHYPADKLVQFWEKLAAVTDFYDFAGYTSPIATERRYYYDTYHFRNCVGDMALAFMFDDDSVYVPQGFGHYTTDENAKEYAEKVFVRNTFETEEANLEVLLYHNISENPQNDMEVSPAKFENDIKYLRENGFNTVSIEDIEDFVFRGVNLPENPILITFDDGYYSNYEYAYPVLKKYDCKAVIFTVGATFGKDKYNGVDILKHFGFEEANEMIKSGVMEIGSHTYDLHQTPETADLPRMGAVPLDGEKDSEFALCFYNDNEQYKMQVAAGLEKSVSALSYPYGKHTSVSEVCAKEMGFNVTFTTEEGSNVLIKGIGQTLFNLKRFSVSENDNIALMLKK